MEEKSELGLIIYYCVGFHEHGSSGKRKATREKLKSFRHLYSNVSFYSPSKRMVSFFGRFIAAVLIELKVVTLILLSKSKPDVIFARTYFGFFYAWAGLLLNIPVVREVHSSFIDEALILYKKKKWLQIFSKVLNTMEVYSLKQTTGIIFNNPDLEQHFLNEYQLNSNRTTSIYNGSNTDDFFPEPVGVVRNKLGLSLHIDEIMYVFTGSVSKWHGVEYLMYTFVELAKRSEVSHQLYVVGGSNTEYRQRIMEMFSYCEQIRFVDEVSTEQARDYINAADICMLPVANIRVSPGSPLKLYDYIACGKPVITQKNVNGYSDVVERYNLGTSVDFFRPIKAADGIINFQKKTKNNDYLLSNRQVSEKILNWNNVIDSWIKFAQNLK